MFVYILHVSFAIERRYPSLKSDLADNGELRHCDVGLRTIPSRHSGRAERTPTARRGRVGCAYYERRSELHLCTIPFPPLCTAQIQVAAGGTYHLGHHLRTKVPLRGEMPWDVPPPILTTDASLARLSSGRWSTESIERTSAKSIISSSTWYERNASTI